jgi:hypothetical protein
LQKCIIFMTLGGKTGTFIVRHELISLNPIKPGLFWENWDERYPCPHTMLLTSNVNTSYPICCFHKMYYFVEYLDKWTWTVRIYIYGALWQHIVHFSTCALNFNAGIKSLHASPCRDFILDILIFKGVTARRLYKSFGVKGLIEHAKNMSVYSQHTLDLTDIIKNIILFGHMFGPLLMSFQIFVFPLFSPLRDWKESYRRPFTDDMLFEIHK